MLSEARKPDLPEWLQELYPFRTRTLQLGDQRLSFVDEGPAQAPVFVLLHGNPTWSFLYRDLVRRLAPDFRVIAPDNIGFGLSSKPSDSAYHTLDRHISNFTRLMQALDLRNVTLVMNGWGGPIGLGYSVTYPQNIARLVLANTWGSNLPHVSRQRPPLGVRVAWKNRLGAWLDAVLNLSMHSMFASRAYRPVHDLALEAYSFVFRGEARTAIPAFTRMFYQPDTETMARLREIQVGLRSISAPADILWGARDPILSKLPAYFLRDDLKHSREPIFLPDGSHYLPEEEPEALADVVLRRAAHDQAKPGSVFKIIG